MAKYFNSSDIRRFFESFGYDKKFFRIQIFESGEAYLTVVNEVYDETPTQTYIFSDYEVLQENDYQVFERMEVFRKQWIRFLARKNGQHYKNDFLSNVAKEAMMREKVLFE